MEICIMRYKKGAHCHTIGVAGGGSQYLHYSTNSLKSKEKGE